jgi:hypothetical protein
MAKFIRANDDSLRISSGPSPSLNEGEFSQSADGKDANMSTSSLGAGSTSNVARVEDTDRYGFYISDESRNMRGISEQEIRFRKRKESERTKKWLKMLNNWERTLSIRGEKLKRRLRKGVPDSLRSLVWIRLCESWRYKKKFSELVDLDASALPAQTAEDVSI